MKHITIVVALISLLFIGCKDESLTGSLIGQVNTDLKEDLGDVKIVLKNDFYYDEKHSDPEGLFFFKDIPRGSYQVTVSNEGYGTVQFTEIILGNGKPNIREIYLKLEFGSFYR